MVGPNPYELKRLYGWFVQNPRLCHRRFGTVGPNDLSPCELWMDCIRPYELIGVMVNLSPTAQGQADAARTTHCPPRLCYGPARDGEPHCPPGSANGPPEIGARNRPPRGGWDNICYCGCCCCCRFVITVVIIVVIVMIVVVIIVSIVVIMVIIVVSY